MTTLSREVTLPNRDGLHARPISQIVEVASRHEAALTIRFDGLEVDGRSILQLMSLGARKGCRLLLLAEGTDAASLLDELERLITSGFGES